MELVSHNVEGILDKRVSEFRDFVKDDLKGFIEVEPMYIVQRKLQNAVKENVYDNVMWEEFMSLKLEYDVPDSSTI